MADILTLQRDVHQNAVDHGFWEASDDIPTKLMLIVTEISEAMEAYRDGKMGITRPARLRDGVMRITGERVVYTRDGKSLVPEDEALEYGKPDGFPVEIADVVIRCMDLAGWLGFDLGAVIELKMQYNSTRPHLHGRKI